MSRPRSGVNRSEPLSQQVARQLRNDIEANVLQDGASLPSTRELAKEWDVSTFTITEAMDVLTQEGLIEVKPRAGRRVRYKSTAAPALPKFNRPQVLFIGGFAGSGKTELGRVIARETSWPMLDKDTLTRPVIEAALETMGHSPHDRESELYLSTIRPREYEALNSAMVENVQCGNSAIVTAPFTREFADNNWTQRAISQCEEDLGAILTFVWINCDAPTMHTYVRHRGAARDAAKLANWSDYLSGIDLNLRPSASHEVVDNSTSSEPLRVQARRLIAKIADKNSETP